MRHRRSVRCLPACSPSTSAAPPAGRCGCQDGTITSGTRPSGPAGSRAAAWAGCGSGAGWTRWPPRRARSAHRLRGGAAPRRHRRGPRLWRLPRPPDGVVRGAGVPYQGVPVGTIKRFATGKGNAGKEAVIAAMRARGFAPADDNEADALALLLWATDARGGRAMTHTAPRSRRAPASTAARAAPNPVHARRAREAASATTTGPGLRWPATRGASAHARHATRWSDYMQPTIDHRRRS